MTDNMIKELLLPFQEEGEREPYYCVGVIVATLGQAMILGAATAAANTYYILGFTDRKLIVISLDMLGKPKNSSTIKYQDFKNVKISNWFFGMGKSIEINLLNKSKIKFKINKMAIGWKITKQKENMEAICSMLEDKFR